MRLHELLDRGHLHRQWVWRSVRRRHELPLDEFTVGRDRKFLEIFCVSIVAVRLLGHQGTTSSVTTEGHTQVSRLSVGSRRGLHRCWGSCHFDSLADGNGFDSFFGQKVAIPINKKK